MESLQGNWGEKSLSALILKSSDAGFASWALCFSQVEAIRAYQYLSSTFLPRLTAGAHFLAFPVSRYAQIT